MLAAVLSLTSNASAQTERGPGDAGDVAVVDPVNVERTVDEGDSMSAFTLLLPEGASCPGDSANDDYRVSTFLVPADTDLDTLRYQALRPDGEAYRSLRYIDGDIFVMEMTNPNPGPGQPGLITQIPPLTMAWYEAGSLAPGPYLMGVACHVADGAVDRYWETEIDLTAAPEVQPGGLRWRIVEPTTAAGPSSTSSSNSTLLVLLFAAAAGLIGAVLIRRRRRHPSPQIQKEPV